jgi:hypothetical protein
VVGGDQVGRPLGRWIPSPSAGQGVIRAVEAATPITKPHEADTSAISIGPA